MKFSPFSTSRRRTFVPVGNDRIGIVYMESTNGIHPIERTEEVQKLEAEVAAVERDRISLLWNVLKISEREAKKRGVSVDEAREQIFGAAQPAADASGSSVTVVKDSPMSLVESEEELRALLGDGVQDEKSAGLKQKLKELVATNMMASRLAWTVEIEPGKPGSVQLSTTKPVLYGLESGQRIRFGETVVVVASVVPEWEDVIPVEKLKSRVEGIGYLLDDDGRELVGTEWTREMTSTLLLTPQIDAIYDFFLEQDAGGQGAIAEATEAAQEENPEEQLGNSSEPLSEEVSPPSLNGATSSSGSKPAVAKIGG